MTILDYWTASKKIPCEKNSYKHREVKYNFGKNICFKLGQKIFIQKYIYHIKPKNNLLFFLRSIESHFV